MGISSLVKAFAAPERSLGNLDAGAAATLIAVAADLSLILDPAGTIQDVAFQTEEMSRELDPDEDWPGRAWTEVVTVESRPKIEALLRDASSKGEPRWRQINFPLPVGADAPFQFSAVRVDKPGRVIAFGRDLRAMSALQQRLVDAQQSIERDYSRLRQFETRYRFMFQVSPESVLIVNATNSRIIEVNPAAERLLTLDARSVVGKGFPDLFDEPGARSVQDLLSGVRAAGRPADISAHLGSQGTEVIVSASMFRQEEMPLFLVRLIAASSQSLPSVLPKAKAKLLKLIENAPDGFVVTGPDARITTTNAAFLEMAQLPAEEHALGQPLHRWLGRSEVDLNVLMSSLRQHGSVRLFATTLRDEFGIRSDVEISATSIVNGGQPCFGFAIRNVTRRLSPEPAGGSAVPRSVEQLTELIGRASLKDLVREATDIIERLCIEAALNRTGNNRASAAEILGLSRQSLYQKLRRHGIDDFAAETGH